MTEDPTTAAGAARSVGSLLVALEGVLLKEKDALKRLDHETLERTTDQKLELSEELARAASDLGAEDRDTLERLRQIAFHNQLVLVHARDTVRQVLALAAGRDPGEPLGGLRVDLRG
jgi:flagellar biosynthesis/type III secretory pathway chaperone